MGESSAHEMVHAAGDLASHEHQILSVQRLQGHVVQ